MYRDNGKKMGTRCSQDFVITCKWGYTPTYNWDNLNNLIRTARGIVLSLGCGLQRVQLCLGFGL